MARKLKLSRRAVQEPTPAGQPEVFRSYRHYLDCLRSDRRPLPSLNPPHLTNLIQRALSIQEIRVSSGSSYHHERGLVAGLLLHYFAPNARQRRVPQVKIAYTMDYGRVPLAGSVVEGDYLRSLSWDDASLGERPDRSSSARGGLEFISKLFSVPAAQPDEPDSVAAAAALAAAFNTPLAAVTFAIEEIIGDLNQLATPPIVIAAVYGLDGGAVVIGRIPLFTGAHVYVLNPPDGVARLRRPRRRRRHRGCPLLQDHSLAADVFRDHGPTHPVLDQAGDRRGNHRGDRPLADALGLGYDFLGTVLLGQDNLVLKGVLALMAAKMIASGFQLGPGCPAASSAPLCSSAGCSEPPSGLVVYLNPTAEIVRGSFA